jgi:hypothetical protein
MNSRYPRFQIQGYYPYPRLCIWGVRFKSDVPSVTPVKLRLKVGIRVKLIRVSGLCQVNKWKSLIGGNWGVTKLSVDLRGNSYPPIYDLRVY